MTMWGPHAGFGEDISKPVAVDPPSKRRRSRRRAWRDGLSDQTVVTNFEDVRAYRAFERAVIGSVDPRSAIELELAHRLASLMWRLRRASAIETGLFEIQGELSASRSDRTPPAQPVSRTDSSPPPRSMAIAKSPARAHQTMCRSATENRCQRPCTRRSDQGRGPAVSPNVSCAFPILTRPCWTASAATKRDCGARPHKRFGPSRRCDNRRLQCGSDCATGSRPSPGIGRGRSIVTASLGSPAAMTRVASAAAHCVNRVEGCGE